MCFHCFLKGNNHFLPMHIFKFTIWNIFRVGFSSGLFSMGFFLLWGLIRSPFMHMLFGFSVISPLTKWWIIGKWIRRWAFIYIPGKGGWTHKCKFTNLCECMAQMPIIMYCLFFNRIQSEIKVFAQTQCCQNRALNVTNMEFFFLNCGGVVGELC